jgi:DNA-directed RNA polymerase specialized sigma24 family protein
MKNKNIHFSKQTILDIQFSAEELITNQETESFKQKNISKLLNKLQKRQKEAIYLKYYSGLKAKEILENMSVIGDKVKIFLILIPLNKRD